MQNRLPIPRIIFIAIATAAFGVSRPVAAESAATVDAQEEWFQWQPLGDLPDRLGVAGAFVGVHQHGLIVAGGSNFPTPKWDGGEKVLCDRIFLLPRGESRWREAGNLSLPIAAGTSVSTSRGVICLGGVSNDRYLDTVFRLVYEPTSDKVEQQPFARLPRACADLAAAACGDFLYVAAGRDSEGEIGRFWRRPLTADAEVSWEELPRYPGPARFGGALVSQAGGEHVCLYLIGGKAKGTYLDEVLCFDPRAPRDQAWRRLAPLPRPSFLPAVAAVGPSHIFVFGGSTGANLDQVDRLREDYRFPREVLAYHTITDTWTSAGTMPVGVAAATAVEFDEGIAIHSGEVSPGLRTAKCYVARLGKAEQRFGLIDYIVLGGYFVAVGAISVYCTRRTHSTEEFLLAGRRIPWWAAGLSLLATQVTSIGVMAIPAKTYATNWAYLAGVGTWFIVVPVVTRYVIPFYRKLNVTSAYEYLEARFAVSLRLFGSASYCLFQLGRMAVVLYLPALALVAITGIDVVAAVVILGILCTLYTVAGGIEAVIWTEVLEATAMLGGVIICLAAVILQIDGGFPRLIDEAFSQGKMQMAVLSWDAMSATLWVVLVGNIFTRLSNLTSDQAIVQRYLTTRDQRTAKLALWTDVAVSIPWALLVFGLGTALFVFYRLHPEQLNPTIKTDGIVPFFISQQLPAGISGLVVAAIMVSAMSSMESSMHSVATLCVADFYTRLRPAATDRNRLWTVRVITLALGLFGTATALMLATSSVASLWDVFQTLMGLFVGSLAGLFLLGMFTKRANSTGALIGAASSIGVLALVTSTTQVHFLLFSAIGVLACVGIGYLASLILPGKGETSGLTVYSTGPALGFDSKAHQDFSDQMVDTPISR